MLLGTILFGLYVFGAVMISRYGALYRDFGWVVARRDGKWVVTDVTPHGPAEGKLQVGDVLLDITDDHLRAPKNESNMSQQYVYVLDALRGTQKLRVEMQSGTRRDDQRPVRKLAIFAAGLGFYLVGLVLGLAKPEDRLTRRASRPLLDRASIPAVRLGRPALYRIPLVVFELHSGRACCPPFEGRGAG